MRNKLIAAILLGVSCTLVAHADDDKKPGEDGKPGKTGKIDKAKIFDKMDANGDGKLTKEEFKDATEKMMERLKDKIPAGAGGKAGGFAEKRFGSMDADKDGSVSKREFEKAEAPRGLKGKGNFKGKRPGAPKQDN